MRYMEEIKEMLCDELERIAKKGELSSSTLDTIDKLTHSVKSITTILAMEGYDSSYRRSPSTGRYMKSRYSRDDGMREKLEALMQDAPDDHTRQELQRLIDKM